MSFMDKLLGRENKTTEPSTQENHQLSQQQRMDTLLASDQFPMVQAADVEISRYRKIPIASLAALGVSFATLPESMRTVTNALQINGTGLYARIIPGDVSGIVQMAKDGLGETGNIMRINAQGKSVIAARSRFQEIGMLSDVTTSVVPFDPVSLAIAAALMRIEQKLDDIQKTQLEILSFLSQQEKAKQRGNLNTLSEIVNDLKLNRNNEKYRSLKYVLVQEIKRDAEQSLCLYQEQIAEKLKQQQAIHTSQQASALLGKVQDDFAEYRLAVYLYAFSSFLETMLLETFEEAQMKNITTKIQKYADRYSELFASCHNQIANYSHASLDHQIVTALGGLVSALGKAVESSPLGQTQLDEMLVGAGGQMGKVGDDATEKLLSQFDNLKESPVEPFTDQLRALDRLYYAPNGLLADAENVYLLEE